MLVACESPKHVLQAQLSSLQWSVDMLKNEFQELRMQLMATPARTDNAVPVNRDELARLLPSLASLLTLLNTSAPASKE
jgi:hypothetical protein